MSTLRILERLQADMPCTAADPNETPYERGKFDGTMAYRRLIDQAHYDVRSGAHASDVVRECRDKVLAALGLTVVDGAVTVISDTLIETVWQEILDKDDRNSPEEYPEMVMLTQKELRDYMQRAVTSVLSGKDGVTS